jgi:hypothetical protein
MQMLKDIKVVLHTSPLSIPEGGQVHLIFEHGIEAQGIMLGIGVPILLCRFEGWPSKLKSAEIYAQYDRVEASLASAYDAS